MRQERAACSAAAPFDLLRIAVARLAAARLGSEKLDPAPAPASPSAPASLGRRATYGTTFDYPAETRSVDTIIPRLQVGTDGLFHLLDPGSRRKVTRYFHSGWRLTFVSESPVRVAGKENSLLRKRTGSLLVLISRLFTPKVITNGYGYPLPPCLLES